MDFGTVAYYPTYWFCVDTRPTWGSAKGKQAYQKAVSEEAASKIAKPIESDDIGVEIIYSSSFGGELVDVDNIAKATLDALKGVAFKDDRQVRELRVARFDLTRASMVSARRRLFNLLFRDEAEHRVVVMLHSQARTDELGGSGAIRRARFAEGWQVHVSARVRGR